MNSQAPINRVTRTKAQARASYDSMSRWYDLFGAAENKYKHIGLQALNAQAGETVLEIGFGTGQCLQALARSVGSSGKVYGIDLSAGMLAVAQARLSKRGLSENVELECGDAASLPYEDNCFDAVYSSFTLELFDTPEIPQVLNECRRVLRPDGRTCIVAMAKKEKSSLMVSLYEWAQHNFTKYVDCRPIYVGAALEKAGFQIKSAAQYSMFGLPVDIVVAKKT